MPTFTPTPQFLAFRELFTTSTSSILVDSVAGSGKTTLLSWGTSGYRKLALATSFATATTKELADRMPPFFESRGLNSIGHRAWGSFVGRLELSRDKMFNIVKDLSPPRKTFSDILALARHAKVAGIIPITLSHPLAHNATPLLPDLDENWEDLALLHDLDYSPETIHLSREAVRLSIIQAFSRLIDFDDQLYMPVCFPVRFPRYPLILVDEAQDLSPIQHRMLSLLLAPSGRIIAAGDHHQAIYAFRGALHDSLALLSSTFSMQPTPLTISFRCPKAVVREAQVEVPYMESAPNAPEGEVHHHTALPLSEIPPAVVCRNNAPLVKLYFRLLTANISARITGRAYGKSLARRISHIVNGSGGRTPRPISIPAFLDLLSTWESTQISEKPTFEEATRDRADTLRAVAAQVTSASGPSATTRSMESLLSEMDRQDNAHITLSTIHRAKGLEWPEVLLLSPELLPSPYAKTEGALQQEANLSYVAKTRAKYALHYASLDSIS